MRVHGLLRVHILLVRYAHFVCVLCYLCRVCMWVVVQLKRSVWLRHRNVRNVSAAAAGWDVHRSELAGADALRKGRRTALFSSPRVPVHRSPRGRPEKQPGVKLEPGSLRVTLFATVSKTLRAAAISGGRNLARANPGGGLSWRVADSRA